MQPHEPRMKSKQLHLESEKDMSHPPKSSIFHFFFIEDGSGLTIDALSEHFDTSIGVVNLLFSYFVSHFSVPGPRKLWEGSLET